MLDTLTLIEQRDMPALPEPRPAFKEKMVALAALEHAVGRALDGPKTPVLNFEREWRARQESNLRPQD